MAIIISRLKDEQDERGEKLFGGMAFKEKGMLIYIKN